jgi:hypothetical protein
VQYREHGDCKSTFSALASDGKFFSILIFPQKKLQSDWTARGGRITKATVAAEAEVPKAIAEAILFGQTGHYGLLPIEEHST